MEKGRLRTACRISIPTQRALVINSALPAYSGNP